ncbi:unnamed protein product [Linum trigynum]|uniref:Uncharacterized protein n=1 Tax=Linum trigynum TaxID=586398 RepID=A0AAV2CE35_9ROSI
MRISDPSPHSKKPLNLPNTLATIHITAKGLDYLLLFWARSLMIGSERLRDSSLAHHGAIVTDVQHREFAAILYQSGRSDHK